MVSKLSPQCMALLRRIQQMEFVAVEINLYLDTHPTDVRALEDYDRIAREIQMLKEQYEEHCGPLLSYGFSRNRGNTWLWNQTPWPWEM